jgi:carbamoyltransferase
MIVLGIHDGHTSGASLVKDGVVIASVSEERLARVKNKSGFPSLAIKDILKRHKIATNEIDCFVFASNYMHTGEHLENVKEWYRLGANAQKEGELVKNDNDEKKFQESRDRRLKQLTDDLGYINSDKISFIEHHLAHLTAAYYTSHNNSIGKEVLGFTCDGSGDNVSATVSIINGNSITRIAETDRHASLGKIYSRVTFNMGMKPWEHEFKLMGLAPYAYKKEVEQVKEVFYELLDINKDSLAFELQSDLSMNYIYDFLHEKMRGVRFDVQAGAIQEFTEEVLVKWVKSAILKTGIKDIVLAGGVFMNVKANMLISQLEEVESIYVMPSCGDESLSIGAALRVYYERTNGSDFTNSILNDLYLGGDNTRQEERSAIDNLIDSEVVEVMEPENINLETAKIVAKGGVVARCSGKMEWGARSLGNRSIVCRADDFTVVDRINKMIKMRDFWMPFAPSIGEEFADRYFDDEKSMKPYFMTYALPSKVGGREHLVAAAHPRDMTIRVNLVTKKNNKSYHEFIKYFEEITGMGAVLNTSFNIHGEPVCYTAEDAIDVFLRSGLDCLALNNFLLRKK